MSTDDHRLQVVSNIIDEMEKDQYGRSIGDVKALQQSNEKEDEVPQPVEEDGFIKKFTEKQMAIQQDQVYTAQQTQIAELGLNDLP